MAHISARWRLTGNLWSFRYGIQPSSHLLPLEMKSVDFDEKSLRFASWMWSIGKHPCPPACGGQRGKNRGFRTLIDTVLRRRLVQIWKNAIGRLPMAWEQEKGADICISTPFEPVSIWFFRLRTVFAPWKALILLTFSMFSYLVLPSDGIFFITFNQRKPVSFF